MEGAYIFIIGIIIFLAVSDLIVGVSNDAVNFLNSAIGSKVISFRNIMILASLGVAVGALSSSGMMEIARKGIFNPEAFFFKQKTAYEIGVRLVGSEMCIRDRI